MFQTEPILFLQSFSNDFWNVFFKFITSLGYEWFLTSLLIGFMFGVSYKKGFFLIQLTLWNGIIIGFLKETFALPRPANVDSRVRLLGKDYPNPTTLQAMGAKNFFGPLPQTAIEYLRTNRFDDFGLPSGHTSGAVTTWGSFFVFYKNIWNRIFCGILIILIPLSRMYLGRHFIADVLSGYVLGFLLLTLFYRYGFWNQTIAQIVFKPQKQIHLDLKNWLLIGYLFFVPTMLLFIPHIEPERVASLLGINFGYFLIWMKGIPNDQAPILRRIIRIIVAYTVYLTARFILGKFLGLIFSEDALLGECIGIACASFCVIWGATELNIKFNFLQRK